MINKFLTVISGRGSIRMQMVWSFIASLIMGFLVSIAIPKGMFFDVPASIIAFFGTFTLSFLVLTRPTIRYLVKLSEGLTIISNGNLRYRIAGRRQDELGKVAERINAMAEKLEAQLERERETEKSKMELITGVSHDLRTPLTSIIGYLELLKGKAYKDEEEYERFIANTHSKAHHLKTLIDELFEYTRLSQGGASLQIAFIDLRELLIQFLSEIEPIAKESRIEVHADVPERQLMIRVDPEQIRRVVDNLLTNAIKFSPMPGDIKVVLAADDGQATITVENEGEPITEEQEARLFERFYKADAARSNDSRRGGAGLGLSIARGIAEQHGGRLTLDYADGKFSFRLFLPLS
ncbi:sensor histidine kinase [Cohnella endophytica]|uniref:histidine kinase n=1 Tax=Cohnella endophytica TaxID=2419778 RepID=A0A494Y095_9BACL|nr:HAMP domain-containing sensor histidine kinase [Cohnella endophytica]RKP56164.1 sensor histidine kinase [Cohnella endophytica]